MTPRLTATEEWVCGTMVFTHGMFAVFGVLAFPLSFLFGLSVYWRAREILRHLPHLDWQSFLALAGIALFLAECFLFVQFWRLKRRSVSWPRPGILWSVSIAVCSLWIAWFYAGAVSVRWHQHPDFVLLSSTFVIWPFTGLVLSAVALYDRARNGPAFIGRR
jgi:hypothetical protein